MFHHQMINFLEAAVVFLLLTNAFSALHGDMCHATAEAILGGCTGTNERRTQAQRNTRPQRLSVRDPAPPSVSKRTRGHRKVSGLASVHSRPSVAALGAALVLVSQHLLRRETLARAVHGFPSSYRPELHYMRGRGPRWWEKHGAVDPRLGDGGRCHRFILAEPEMDRLRSGAACGNEPAESCMLASTPRDGKVHEPQGLYAL